MTATHCLVDKRGRPYPRELVFIEFFSENNDFFLDFLLTQIFENSFQFQIMGDDLSISKAAGNRRQIRKVKKVITHPRYETNPTTINDIAILFVCTF